MESLRELYRIGAGPSSSHTMGPQRAARVFRARHPEAKKLRVTLYGSLAATGRGHLSDVALRDATAPLELELVWHPEIFIPFHPNGMDFQAIDVAGKELGQWRVFSVGGGAIREEHAPPPPKIYSFDSMAGILMWHQQHRAPLWMLVEKAEGAAIWDYLREVWTAMNASIERGLAATGSLPGGLKLQRKARDVFNALKNVDGPQKKMGLLSAYGLAVMEENASAGIVATAPTCGACGVVPAVLRYCQESRSCREDEILKALAVAGLVGNLVKKNASISGAEVGCQGEIGTACAMAAAAAAQILGGTPRQIEYAAEIAMEHHLGLTCDPILGLVQIPCIERNVFAATRAIDAAEYALLGDGTHRISFDQVVKTMKETGKALPSAYRETSQGGLARLYAEHPM